MEGRRERGGERVDRVVSSGLARAMNKALCLLPPLFALGCFDVETVDPGTAVEPFLVDDFESSDELPRPPFQKWACRALQPDDDPTGIEGCAFDPEAGTSTAFVGRFALRDEPNGITEYEGASLSTSTTRPVDLRRYRELAVSVRFFARDIVIGNAPNNLYIELTCRSARVEGVVGGPSGEVASLFRQVPLNAGAWSPYRIDLVDFIQPPWQLDRIDGGTEACLARIDSLALVLSTDVADGSTGRVELSIDNVSFE
jgi:hypothetical protein